MFFFSLKSSGWIVLICSVILLGITVFGVVSNGLEAPGAKEAAMQLVGGSVVVFLSAPG